MQQHFLKKKKNSWPVLPSGSTSENGLPEPEDDIRRQSLIGGNDIIQKEAQVAFVSEERSAPSLHNCSSSRPLYFRYL